MARVAINGLGRIGRATIKIVLDTPGLDLVAANDLGAPDSIAYLLKYDTVYGRYEKTVDTANDGTGYSSQLVREALRNGKQIEVLAAKRVVSSRA